MVLLIVYVLIALGISFLCSVMEAVLLSVRPSYVAVLERDEHPAAGRLRAMKEDVERPLAAILSLNTIAHTVGAAGAGAQATKVFGDAYVGLISAALTLLILVISEILPKTLGAVHWRTLAPLVTRILVPTVWLMWPLVKLAQGLTRMLQRNGDEASMSREEFTAMAEIGEQEGVFEAGESRILQSLLRFSSLRVRDVMTPRVVVFSLPEASTIARVIDEDRTLRFSRIPVYGQSPDDITGYVLKDEMLLAAARGQDDKMLRELRRNLTVVPDVQPLPELFKRLMEAVEHIALVVDEYGGVAGIVTLEDVVETLLGLEIVDEVDSVQDMQLLARRQWSERARRMGLFPDDHGAAVTLGLTGEHPPARKDRRND